MVWTKEEVTFGFNYEAGARRSRGLALLQYDACLTYCTSFGWSSASLNMCPALLCHTRSM